MTGSTTGSLPEDWQALLRLHHRYRFDPAGLSAHDKERLAQRVAEWLREQAG